MGEAQTRPGTSEIPGEHSGCVCEGQGDVRKEQVRRDKNQVPGGQELSAVMGDGRDGKMRPFLRLAGCPGSHFQL